TPRRRPPMVSGSPRGWRVSCGDVDSVSHRGGGGGRAGRVVAHLRGGGLLAYPTETVYGLGSRPRAGEVRALAELKGRRPDKPFLLLVASREMAEAQGLAFNESASALARAFWPGPLTLVLPGGGGRLPDSLRGPEGGIAVRWTSHPHTARLVPVLGEP